MKIAVLSKQLKPLLLYWYVCIDSNSYSQRNPSLPSMMLKFRSKEVKDDGRKTSKKAWEITATPRNENNGSKYNLYINGIFSKIIKSDAHEICKYHSGYRSSHKRLQKFKVILLFNDDLLSSAE